MKRTEYILILATIFLIALFCISLNADAQDVHVDCAGVNPCTLTPGGGLPWSQANQTWIITPLGPNVDIFITVHNQNTTNGHTQTLTVFQTSFGKPTAGTLTNNSDFWVQDAVTQNSTANASCNSVATNVTNSPGASGLGVCYARGMNAGQLAIRITGASAAAGSPDNVDIVVQQSLSNYVSGPQPGSDESSGGLVGTNLAFGNNFADSSVASSISSFRQLNCVNQISSPFTLGPCVYPVGTALLGVSFLERWRSANSAVNGGSGIGVAAIAGYGFDGASKWFYDDVVSLAGSTPAANGSVTPITGATISEKGSRWMITSNPASGSTASASIAATANVRHVVDCYAFAADASAAVTAAESKFVIRDGATGAGTIIWQVQDAIQVAAALGIQTQGPLNMCGLNLVGTTNTAMTCEFTAGAAGNHQSVSCSGYDIQ